MHQFFGNTDRAPVQSPQLVFGRRRFGGVCAQQALADRFGQTDDDAAIVLVVPEAVEFKAELVHDVALVRVLP